MDNLKPEQRKKNMQNIRSSDTKMEILVRSALYRKGFRFRKNVKNMVGKPDIVFPRNKLVVFLDSCFWHYCPYHSNIPATNKTYWLNKLKRNRQRDKEVNNQLKIEKWTVLRFWEHEIKNNFDSSISKIVYFITDEN